MIRYLYKYWKLQAVIIVLGLIILPLSLVNPYLSKLIIDKAYGEKNLNLFLILILISGGILVFNTFISSLNGYLSHRIKRGVRFDIMLDFFRHLQTLPMGFLNDRATGGHIYRITSDINSVSNFICDVIPRALELLPRCVFILVIVFYLNWKIALLTVLLFPAACLNAYIFGKRLRETNQKFMQKSEDIFIRLQETFNRIPLVKAFGREEYEAGRLKASLDGAMDVETKTEKISMANGLSGFVFNNAAGGIIVIYGGYQVIKGDITLGGLTAVMIYVLQLINLIGSIASFYERITIK